MPNTIENDKLIRTCEYLLLILISIIGIGIVDYFIKVLFNFGVYVGTFIRGLYSAVC